MSCEEELYEKLTDCVDKDRIAKDNAWKSIATALERYKVTVFAFLLLSFNIRYISGCDIVFNVNNFWATSERMVSRCTYSRMRGCCTRRFDMQMDRKHGLARRNGKLIEAETT
jgi:hypothetical protein